MLRYIKKQFLVSNKDIKQIIQDFDSEMQKGLVGDNSSSLKMLPGFVDRADGTEKGVFLAIDLGGTNLRILSVKLDGKGNLSKPIVLQKVIPEKYKAGKEAVCDNLFGFIAETLKNFIKKNKLQKKYRLGFTFSFPTEQDSINSGILKYWCKGFNVAGVEGKDIVLLLDHALRKYGIDNVEITALCNDTLGAFETIAYLHSKCSLGVILGTGTNGCYSEKTKNILKLKNKEKYKENMLINIEWGNFNKLNKTKYDEILDKNTETQGLQILEKMVSGKYLGEITRLVLVDLISEGQILNKKYLSVLSKLYEFKTKYMSEIESDDTDNLDKIENVFERYFSISGITLKDRRLIKQVCGIVSARSAYISGAVMSAVIKKIDPCLKQEHIIAVDGSLYEKYHGFKLKINQALFIGLGKKHKIIMRLAKDGSGIGAGVIAATEKP